MTPQQLDQLEAIARAAPSAGPWHYDGRKIVSKAHRSRPIVLAADEGRCYADHCCGGHGIWLELNPRDAMLMAACDPGTVLELVRLARRGLEEA